MFLFNVVENSYAELDRLVGAVGKTHEPAYIHSTAGDAVLVSKSDYEEMMETIGILSVPGNENILKEAIAEYRRGETLPADEFFAKIDDAGHTQ